MRALALLLSLILASSLAQAQSGPTAANPPASGPAPATPAPTTPAPTTPAPTTPAPASAPAPATPAQATSTPASSTALTPAQAQGVLDVLQDDKKRQAFEAVLQSMVRAIPAEAPKTGPLDIAPDSVGAQLVVQVSKGVQGAAEQFSAAAVAVNDTPLLWSWAVGIAQDPSARARVLDAVWRLAVVLACAGAGEWLLKRALRRPRRAVVAHAPADGPEPSERRPGGARLSGAWRLLRRLPYVAACLALDLLAVAGFAGIGNAILSTPLGNTNNTRLVVIGVVNAYVACRVIMCGVRTLVAPDAPQLRLVHCTEPTARYIVRWSRRLVAVGVFGFAIAEVGLLFGLYRSAHDAVIKLVGLVIHGMLVIIVLQTRQAVEHRLRARRAASGMLAILQNQFAARWHGVAIFYIVALWLVGAAEIKDGYVRLLHFFLVTTGVLTAARLIGIMLLGGVDRGLHAMGKALPGLEPRLGRYDVVLRLTLSGLLFVATITALLEVWGYSPLGWFGTGKLGGRVLSAALTSAFTLGIAAAVWETANFTVENHLAGLTRQAQTARAARLRTLLPMLRTALMVSLVLIAGLIVLSEIGVNVAPLLAGAGVLGVAIGFGSQKLVQDLITGLFLLLENTMQVGDVVSLGGLTGTVENLSIRTIRLRALDGSVHIIPFSSVSTVTNQTRDFSYALIDLQVGLNEEPDTVADLLRDIVRAMRAEPRWQDSITADLDVMGVNAFSDNYWTLRLRIRTVPAQRWAVNREFNRRVKYRFDELGVQSPITAWRAQGWLPPGAERPMVPPPASLPPNPPAAAPAPTPEEASP